MEPRLIGSATHERKAGLDEVSIDDAVEQPSALPRVELRCDGRIRHCARGDGRVLAGGERECIPSERHEDEEGASPPHTPKDVPLCVVHPSLANEKSCHGYT